MLWNIFVLTVAAAPMLIITAKNYERWKARYGPNVTIISYYFRYMTARKETDDRTLVYVAKSIICVVWAVITIGLFME